MFTNIYLALFAEGISLVLLITINNNSRPCKGQTAITPGHTRGYELTEHIALQLVQTIKAFTIPGAQLMHLFSVYNLAYRH